MGTFVLRLRLGAGQPFAGSIGRPGRGAALPFHGWIEFMSAVNRLRYEEPDPRGSADR